MNAPEEIYHVSRGRLAGFCSMGGCVYNGSHYTYDVTRDVLTRDDVRRRREVEAHGNGHVPNRPRFLP